MELNSLLTRIHEYDPVCIGSCRRDRDIQLIRLFDPSGYLSYTAIYSAIFAFFCLGTALISIGMFMSSLTENVFISAIVTFVTLLVCYLMGQLADIMPSAAGASAIVFALIIFLIALLVFFVTKSRTAGWVVFMVLETPIVVICFVKGSLLEGLLPKVFGVLSIFERFYTFAEGLFDLKIILYFLTIAVLFIVFTVQSMEKRRWS
jgi:ABC-2 type transport system permease protein